ncbi:MAG: hypothetical protein HY774_01065 [Acidobacteria bacterium]|nr:hypothetical protein [Acidobacteriota bacterium]
MRLRSNLLICFFGYLVLIARLGSGAVSAQEKTASQPTLAELAFIAGTWQGELGGGATEEQWNPPSGDSMMGMFRYVQNGKAVFYEFMLIEQTPDGPVLRLRHFNPRLVAWEDKTGTLNFPLVEFRKNYAVFDHDSKERLIFHRKSADSLTITLEKTKDGQKTAEAFNYKLKK